MLRKVLLLSIVILFTSTCFAQKIRFSSITIIEDGTPKIESSTDGYFEITTQDNFDGSGEKPCIFFYANNPNRKNSLFFANTIMLSSGANYEYSKSQSGWFGHTARKVYTFTNPKDNFMNGSELSIGTVNYNGSQTIVVRIISSWDGEDYTKYVILPSSILDNVYSFFRNAIYKYNIIEI
jgi:hypothetical protein